MLAILRLILVTLLAANLLLAEDALSADADGDVLIVSQDHSWPPFAWRNDGGEPEGLLIDLWLEIGQRLGRPVEFRLVDWPDTITGVAEGHAHVHGGLFRSPERERLLDFSIEMMPLSAFMFVDAGLLVMGVEELVDHDVGVVAGSMELEHMRRHHPEISLIEFGNNEMMVAAALDGRLQAFVADYPVGMYLLDLHGAPAEFRPLTRLYQRSISAAVKKGDQELLAQVNEVLAGFDEADMRRLLQRWMRSERVEILPAWLLPSILAGAILLALLTYAIFLFRQRRWLELQVAERTRQLGEQERMFRTLFENAGAGIFMLEGERFSAVNSALTKLFGYPKEELLESDVFELVHPEDRKKIINRTRARQRGENVPRQYSYRIIRSDGQTRWVELTADVVFAERGPITIGTLYDLTDHYQLEQRLRASEAKFRTLVENANDLIYSLSPAGFFEYVSPNWTDMLGFPVEQVEDRHYSEFLHPDDVDGFRDFVDGALRTGSKQSGVEYRIRNADGDFFWHTSNVSPLMDDSGEIVAVSGIARDISGQRKIADERRWQHEFRRLIADISTDILNAPINRISETMEAMLSKLGEFFAVDRTYIYRLTDNGESAQLLHEWCSKAIPASDEDQHILKRSDYPWWFDQAVVHMRNNKPFYIEDVTKLPETAANERKLFESQDISTLVTMPLRSGEEMIGFFGFDSCHPRHWERELDSLLVVMANLLSDVFEKIRLEQELMRSSITDPLTGLYNRRYLLTELEMAIRQYKDQQLPFALVMMDIDHFKELNDTFGHLAGDAVLEQLGVLVAAHSREGYVIGRYGGEEFIILLKGLDAGNAQKVTEQLLKVIREHEFTIDNSAHRITVSAGMVASAELKPGQIDADMAIGQADNRLYRAKREGRDRLVTSG